jgi:methyl-accepting chemotaxis protein
MQFIRNFTLAQRLFSGGVVLLILVAVFSIFTRGSLQSIRGLLEERERVAGLIDDLFLLQSDYSEIALALRNYTVDANQKWIGQIQQSRKTRDELLTKLRGIPTLPGIAGALEKFDSLKADRQRLADEIIAAVNQQKSSREIESLLERRTALEAEAANNLQAALSLARTEFARLLSDSNQQLAQVQRNTGIFSGSVVALVFAILIGLFFSIVPTVRGAVSQMVSAAGSLASSSQQTVGAAQQTASVAQQLASGAAQQSKQAEEISKALSQMAAAVQQMSAAAQEASASATQTSKVAQETGESSTKINEIVTTITAIAEQTNLLALNAAIEAARVGEAGRGFAVVADEVRKLAEGSRKSAEEIKGVIKGVGGKVSDTITSVRQVSAKIQELAAGIQQQSASLQQIAKTMDSVATVAEQNSSGAQQLSASTQQTSAANQQVAAAAQQLQALAEELQKLAGKSKDALERRPIPREPSEERELKKEPSIPRRLAKQ